MDRLAAPAQRPSSAPTIASTLTTAIHRYILTSKTVRPSLNRFVHIKNWNVRRVDDLCDHIVRHVDLTRLFWVGCDGPDVQSGANRSAVAQGYLRHAMADVGNGGAGARTDLEGKRLEISEGHCIHLVSRGLGITTVRSPVSIIDTTPAPHIPNIQTATIVASVARPPRIQP